MPDLTMGLIGSSLLGSVISSDATSSAASTQAGAAQGGIDEQRRQFEAVQQLLAPYIKAGTGAINQFQPFQEAGQQAFQQQQALAGLLGPDAQQQAIAGIEGSAGFQANVRQGEEALLSRASATGGLRGGNIQGALAQFRPQLLQQEIDKQYARLGGFAGTGLGVSEALYRGGQASATGQASQAGAVGANVANLLAQQGAAQAGGELAGAAPFANLLGLPLQMAGINYGRTGQFGLPGFKGFGGFDSTFRSPVSGNGEFNNLFYASNDPMSATGPQ